MGDTRCVPSHLHSIEGYKKREQLESSMVVYEMWKKNMRYYHCSSSSLCYHLTAGNAAGSVDARANVSYHSTCTGLAMRNTTQWIPSYVDYTRK